ncbi:MAG TPA: deoxyribonuclease IV [Thermomicrobiales bacterium]|nr:deoxyribonuclease IV [Thermomicrobiales bacterium]
MTIEFGSHVSASGGVDKVFARAEEVGATSIQIFSKNERQWTAKPLEPDVVENFHRERERMGIDPKLLVIHDSYLINLASPKEENLAKSLVAFRDELERGDALGIPNLVTHPGAHTGSGVETGVARFAQSLNELFDAMPDSKTITLLETTAGQGSSLGRSFEELAAIIDQVEDKSRVGVCLDTCHIFAAGYDFRTPEQYAETMGKFDEIVGIKYLRALHLNDSKNPLGSFKDRHDMIGAGEIGIEGFRHFVNDARLAGIPGILETEKDPAGDNDRKNLATLRDLYAG